MSDATSSPNVTNLLVAWGKGDRQAFDRLMPQVQQELHRIADHYMAAERPGHDLQATALINEAYLRLVDWKEIQWADRAHFFAMAANMMRRVLVDYARRRHRAKRGDDPIQVSLSEAGHVPIPERADVLALDESGMVIDCVSNLRPWRVRLPRRGTAGVLELPAGTLAASQTSLGGQILIELGGRETP